MISKASVAPECMQMFVSSSDALHPCGMRGRSLVGRALRLESQGHLWVSTPHMARVGAAGGAGVTAAGLVVMSSNGRALHNPHI